MELTEEMVNEFLMRLKTRLDNMSDEEVQRKFPKSIENLTQIEHFKKFTKQNNINKKDFSFSYDIGLLVGAQICLMIPRLSDDINNIHVNNVYKLTDEELKIHSDLYNRSIKTKDENLYNEYLAKEKEYRFKYLPHEVTYYSNHLNVSSRLVKIIKESQDDFYEGLYSAFWDDDFFFYSFAPEIEYDDEYNYFILKFTLN